MSKDKAAKKAKKKKKDKPLKMPSSEIHAEDSEALGVDDDDLVDEEMPEGDA